MGISRQRSYDMYPKWYRVNNHTPAAGPRNSSVNLGNAMMNPVFRTFSGSLLFGFLFDIFDCFFWLS